MGVRRRDALAAHGAEPFPRMLSGNREREPAAAKVETPYALEARVLAVSRELQALLLEHVEADDTQFADVFLHQLRNVVIAHKKNIEGQVFTKPDELVLPAGKLQSAAS